MLQNFLKKLRKNRRNSKSRRADTKHYRRCKRAMRGMVTMKDQAKKRPVAPLERTGEYPSLRVAGLPTTPSSPSHAEKPGELRAGFYILPR